MSYLQDLCNWTGFTKLVNDGEGLRESGSQACRGADQNNSIYEGNLDAEVCCLEA